MSVFAGNARRPHTKGAPPFVQATAACIKQANNSSRYPQIICIKKLGNKHFNLQRTPQQGRMDTAIIQMRAAFILGFRNSCLMLKAY
jgi:hypothetical protein